MPSRAAAAACAALHVGLLAGLIPGAGAQQPAGQLAGPPAEPRAGAERPPFAPPVRNDAGQALAPIADGSIVRLLTNPYGEVDGLWLGDGTIVRCSPQLGRQLARDARPGDEVDVTGVFYAPGTVRATSIANMRSGTVLTEPATQAGRAAAHDAELEEMAVEGSIAVVLRGRRSEAHGVILDDGSIVRFPPYTMPFVVRSGQPFAATGRGTRSGYGTSIEALSVGRSLAMLQPLYAGHR